MQLTSNQRSSTLAAASCLVLAALLVGCSTFRTFERAQARSSELKSDLGDIATQVREDTSDGLEREERLRYLARVIDVVKQLDQQLIEAMTRELSPRQERVIESAFLLAFDNMELYARFPGRVSADGVPADAITQQTLIGLTEDAEVAPGT